LTYPNPERTQDVAEQEVVKDENGKEVRSGAAKWLSPTPAPEDLTRVKVGDGPADYEYVDPASLFALQRVMAGQHSNKYVKKGGQGHKKFVRDIAEKAFPFWPAGGYVTIHANGSAATTEPIPDEDQMGLFEEGLGNPESEAWSAATPPEPDLINDGEELEEELDLDPITPPLPTTLADLSQ
jgi:hypothetical protein